MPYVSSGRHAANHSFKLIGAFASRFVFQALEHCRRNSCLFSQRDLRKLSEACTRGICYQSLISASKPGLPCACANHASTKKRRVAIYLSLISLLKGFWSLWVRDMLRLEWPQLVKKLLMESLFQCRMWQGGMWGFGGDVGVWGGKCGFGGGISGCCSILMPKTGSSKVTLRPSIYNIRVRGALGVAGLYLQVKLSGICWRAILRLPHD